LQIREKIKKIFSKTTGCKHEHTMAARTALVIAIHCTSCKYIVETYNRKAEEWT
jgi:hypothetical protein